MSVPIPKPSHSDLDDALIQVAFVLVRPIEIMGRRSKKSGDDVFHDPRLIVEHPDRRSCHTIRKSLAESVPVLNLAISTAA